MGTTPQDIEEWFDTGVKDKKEFLIVVCDTFSHEDYPVYVSKENFWEKHDSYSYKNMQMIIEVYDLKKDKTAQLKEHRSYNCPSKIIS